MVLSVPGYGRRPSLHATLIVLGIAIALAIVGFTALALWTFRTNALTREESSLGNLVIVFAEQVDRAMQAVDLILTMCAASARPALEAPRPAADDGALAAELRKGVAGAPQLQTLAVYDISGRAIASSGNAPASWDELGGIGLEAALDVNAPRLVIGHPLGKERAGGETIPVAYRIAGNDNRSLGVVVAFLNPSYFTNLIRSLDLGHGGRVMLFNRSGVLLTGYPLRPEWVGRSFAGSAVLASAWPPASAVVRHRGVLDDTRRLTATRGLSDFPLAAAVSMTERHILGPWHAAAQQFGGGALGSALLILALMYLFVRQLRIANAADANLRQSAERLDGIIQSAMDAIITVDRQQRILLFNAAAERVFRCPADEAIGAPLDRFLPERFRAAHRAHVERFGATGVSSRRMGDRMALAALRADGEEFPIDAAISQTVVNGEKVYTVILRDITEQRRAERKIEDSHRQLRELAGVMNNVREAERTRIARELHDELAQWLTALKMDTAWLAARLPAGSSEMTARTGRMAGVIDDAVKAVRRIAADLRPTILNDLGLVAALEWLAQDFSQRYGIIVRMEAAQGDLAFQEPLVTTVFRIVQEALTNVARHAQATEIVIALRADDMTLKLRVSDNGHGVDLAVLDGSGSYGLLGIRERARTLGGTAEFASAPGDGFSVDIAIPLEPYGGETVAA